MNTVQKNNTITRKQVQELLEENQETAINAKGPYIEQKYLELLYKKLEKIKNEDILILSGSVPNGVPNDIYVKK